MPCGVVVALSEEALRALQDAIPFHEALRRRDADSLALAGICAASNCALPQCCAASDKSIVGSHNLDGRAALDNTMGMAMDVLVCRCWLGTRHILHEDAQGAWYCSGYITRHGHCSDYLGLCQREEIAS